MEASLRLSKSFNAANDSHKPANAEWNSFLFLFFSSFQVEVERSLSLLLSPILLVLSIFSRVSPQTHLA